MVLESLDHVGTCSDISYHRTMADERTFRRLALSFDGAEEGSHMGAVDFRVGGRIFATLASIAHGYGNLMLDPDQQAAFCAEMPDGVSTRGGRMGPDGRHTLYAWRQPVKT